MGLVLHGPAGTARRLALVASAALALAACAVGGGPAPTASSSSPRPSPTTAGPSATPARLVLLVRHGDAWEPTWLTLHAHADPGARVVGLRATGGVVGGTAYVLVPSDTGSSAVELTASGSVRPLTIVGPDPSTLAVADGTPATLAWAVDARDSTRVEVAPAAGGAPTVVLSAAPSVATDRAYAVARWADDGRQLLVGMNPTGLGGYDVYFGNGLTSLSRVDIASSRTTVIVPYRTGAAMLCLDDMTPDERLLVDTCTKGAVTVHRLPSGAVSTILPPTGADRFRYLRSARLSPDGTRVAYSLNRGDPSAEEGAVAVSTRLGGSSRLLLTVPRSSVLVDGWLDSTTLVVETTQVTGCTDSCATTSSLLDVTSGRLTELGEGRVVAIDLGGTGG